PGHFRQPGFRNEQRFRFVHVHVIDGNGVDADGGKQAGVVADAAEILPELAAGVKDRLSGVPPLDGTVGVVPMVDHAEFAPGRFRHVQVLQGMADGQKPHQMERAVQDAAVRTADEQYPRLAAGCASRSRGRQCPQQKPFRVKAGQQPVVDAVRPPTRRRGRSCDDVRPGPRPGQFRHGRTQHRRQAAEYAHAAGYAGAISTGCPDGFPLRQRILQPGPVQFAFLHANITLPHTTSGNKTACRISAGKSGMPAAVSFPLRALFEPAFPVFDLSAADSCRRKPAVFDFGRRRGACREAGQPFTPPTIMPLTKYVCRNGYTMMIGTDATIVIVARIDIGVTEDAPRFCELAKADAAVIAACEFCKIFCSSYCSVLSLMFDELYSMTSNHEFHWYTPENSATVASTGIDSGSTMLKNVRKSPAPSMRDASRMPSGSPSMNERMMIRLNTPISHGQMYTQKLLISPRLFISRNVGMRPPLTYIVSTKMMVTNLRSTKSGRLIV